tara:strand:+ start:2266 stop:2454 length:189 start_codon:yes stop_codon:yes gene_type:complete
MTKFGRLDVGTKFTLDGQECEKVNPVKKSCCQLKRNARIIEGDEDLIIDGNKEVKVIENEQE